MLAIPIMHMQTSRPPVSTFLSKTLIELLKYFFRNLKNKIKVYIFLISQQVKSLKFAKIIPILRKFQFWSYFKNSVAISLFKDLSSGEIWYFLVSFPQILLFILIALNVGAHSFGSYTYKYNKKSYSFKIVLRLLVIPWK